MPKTHSLLGRLLISTTSFLAVVFATTALAQSDARAILERSAQAMGGTTPGSSDARGTIRIVEGSAVRDGSIQVLTKGITETNDIIEAGRHQEEIFNNGRAVERDAGVARSLNKERTASAFSVAFPLVLFRSILNDPDTGYEYVGTASAEGRACDHVRVWNSYASRPELRDLAPATVKDIWIDAGTNLPVKLSFQRWEARGAIAGIPLVVVYSDFRQHVGILYPHHTEKSLNGTPWSTVRIQSVAIDTPVSAGSFATE